MYFRRKSSAGRVYLQIVESRRQGNQVRQQVIATLGRYDELRDSGQLDRLLRSGARFAAQAIILDAARGGMANVLAVRRIGPALGIVTVIASGRLVRGGRDWRYEAAARPALPPPLCRRDHQPCRLAVSRVQP